MPDVNGSKPRIWVLPIMFKKNGFPSLGTFGVREEGAVIMTMATWKELCNKVPALQTMEFDVGHYVE